VKKLIVPTPQRAPNSPLKPTAAFGVRSLAAGRQALFQSPNVVIGLSLQGVVQWHPHID